MAARVDKRNQKPGNVIKICKRCKRSAGEVYVSRLSLGATAKAILQYYDTTERPATSWEASQTKLKTSVPKEIKAVVDKIKSCSTKKLRNTNEMVWLRKELRGSPRNNGPFLMAGCQSRVHKFSAR